MHEEKEPSSFSLIRETIKVSFLGTSETLELLRMDSVCKRWGVKSLLPTTKYRFTGNFYEAMWSSLFYPIEMSFWYRKVVMIRSHGR